MTKARRELLRTVAAEYLRISDDRTKVKESPVQQHAGNVKLAARKGWTLKAEPYEDLVSASQFSKKRRPNFDRLIEDLRNDTFNAGILILWESSRGSRRQGEWATLLDLCVDRGVLIHVTSHDRTYDPSNHRDRKTLDEDVVDAAYESAKISLRTKRNHAAYAEEGRPTGRVPFGYRRDYDSLTRRLIRQVAQPEEAAVIVELYTRLKAHHSLRSIAEDFKARGIKTRTGREFSSQHLRNLALMHCYAGDRIHDPDRRSGNRYKRTEQARITKGQWQALVDRETWLAVQQILSDPVRRKVRPGRGIHLLSMLVVCDVCEGPLTVRSERGVRYYRCQRGTHVQTNYDQMNAFAEAQIIGYLGRADQAAGLWDSGADREALAQVRQTIAEVQVELKDLADQVGSGALSASFAARAEPGILRRLRTAQKREAELATPSTLRGLIDPHERVQDQWDKMPMAARRVVVKLVFSPDALGQFRLARAPRSGFPAVPVAERVVFARS